MATRIGKQLDTLAPIDSSIVDENRSTTLPPNSPFRYRYHPELWELAEIDGEPYLVPQLAVDVIVPGVNGILAVGDSNLVGHSVKDIGAAVKPLENRRRSEGFRYLPPDYAVTDASHLPPGVAPGPLMRQIESTARGAAKGGVRHHDCWTTFPGAGSIDGVKEEFHRAPFQRWQRDVAKAGGFGRIPAEAKGRLRRAIENDRSTLQGQRMSLTAEIYAERVKRLDDAAKRLEQAITNSSPAEKAA